MEPPPPDPAKLLAYWNEWEDGKEAPGRVLSNLKTAGLDPVSTLRMENGQFL